MTPIKVRIEKKVIKLNIKARGPSGINGETVELRNNGTNVQWKYTTQTEDEWQVLIPLVDLKGDPGEPGDPGNPGEPGQNGLPIELWVDDPYIKWRVSGDPEWTNLIELSAITGPEGPPGAPGAGVAAGGTTGQFLKKTSNDDYDTEWGTPDGSGDMAAATYDPQEIGGDAFDRGNHTGEQAISTVTGLQGAIDDLIESDLSKLDTNASITGATKTKITYDAKGLVTSGDDATQDDIGDGTTNKQYSEADKSKLAGIESGATADQVASEVPVTPTGNLAADDVQEALGELQEDINTINSSLGGLTDVVVLKGVWDASGGSFPGGGSAKAGWSYIVSVSGTVGGIDFIVNDRLLAITNDASTSTYAGNWHKLDYTDQVLSVNSQTGAVTLDPDDMDDSATAHKFTSESDISKLSGIEAGADVTDVGNIGSSIHGATAKTTPIDADTIPIIDSAASNVLKKLSWANIKATLKTYFDTLYNLYTHPNHSGDVTSVADGATTIANDAVTYAKMQNVSATSRVLGRITAGSGDVEELTGANIRTIASAPEASGFAKITVASSAPGSPTTGDLWVDTT